MTSLVTLALMPSCTLQQPLLWDCCAGCFFLGQHCRRFSLERAGETVQDCSAAAPSVEASSIPRRRIWRAVQAEQNHLPICWLVSCMQQGLCLGVNNLLRAAAPSMLLRRPFLAARCFLVTLTASGCGCRVASLLHAWRCGRSPFLLIAVALPGRFARHPTGRSG